MGRWEGRVKTIVAGCYTATHQQIRGNGVSNSSPLILIARIGRHRLLRDVYGEAIHARHRRGAAVGLWRLI